MKPEVSVLGVDAVRLALGEVALREDVAHFPVSERAARYGAAVSTPTDDGTEAYAEWWQEAVWPVPNPWPLG